MIINKYLFTLLFSLISLGALAQANKKTLNYQAVILDPKAIDIPGASITGQPLNKGNVCLRFSLLNATGGLDYEETQQVTTDEFGLVSVAIGTGTQGSSSKSFESVQWNASVKSLKVSVSYDGCSSFKQVSTQSFNYTPYALYAEAVDYKNVREAPTKLSQFSNDAGFLIPKDLDLLKTDIQANSSKIATANQNIADNKQASNAAFLVVNQSISTLDKQVAQNTSSITTMGTKLTDQQNQISDNRNQISATNNSMNAQIGGLQGQINNTNNTVSNLTGVAEMQSNKSTAINLGGAYPSDQAYPSQKAAKAYVDQVVSQIATSGVPDATTLAAGKIQLAGDLGGTATSPTVPALAGKENTSNKSLSVQTNGSDDTKYPSVKAVKDYVDQATQGTALAADLAAKANLASPSFSGTPVLPTGTTGVTQTSGDNSTKLATTAYVDAQVAAGAADATISMKGIVKLTGDLGGTATSPTVPGLALKANTADVSTSLALKEDISNKSNAALGTSTTLYPTQNAVKTYVDAQVAVGAADATTSTKGLVILTGDLGGSATSPSVVKLRGTPISSVAPATPGHVLTYDVNGNATWAAPANSANTISGVVPVANGGTGLSSLTNGGAVYASSSSAFTTGTLPITAGGTGVTSQQAAINNLTGTQSAGKYLRSDGTDARLSTIQASDVPTLNQNTTGTAANVTGTVAVENGGTGATTKTNAFDALSPMTASGDLIYGGASGTGTRLAKGTDGHVLTLASGIPSWSAPAGSSAHYVGEAYGGGIVFFVWDNGAHGLIVATNEIGNKGPRDFTSITGMLWGPVLTTGAFRSGYGGGEGNTNVMISKISNSGQQWFQYALSVANMYSAMAAQQYNSTYGDWYLPSAAELQLVRLNQSSLTGSGYNNTHVYWSSTETNDSYAYTLATNGSTPWATKSTLNWILPVRKF